VKTLQETRSEWDESKNARRELIREIASIRAATNRRLAESEKIESQQLAAQQRLAIAKSELDKEIERRTRELKLPEARVTRKREIAVVLRYGRMYVPDKEMPGGEVTVNTDDMLISEVGRSEMRITPKPYAGVKLNERDQLRHALIARFSHKPKNLYYFAVLVWDDSFAEFSHLREILIERGYEYRLILVPQGGTIIEDNVPNPLVQ
jgi:hypothetical protein